MTNNKKYLFGFLGIIAVILIIFLFTNNISQKTPQLSELQITACNAADQANTCNTRLPEIGIVLKEDCCKALGKCCS